MTDQPTFTDRLRRRHRLWWGPPWRASAPTPAALLHRARERRAHRDRRDPDATWRCCELWPRTVVDKWNGREFAARHDCPLPELLWYGSDHARAPLDSLPEEFAIRPVLDYGGRGVMAVAGGREWLHGGEPIDPGQVRAGLPRTRILQRRAPILIEEFVRTWSDRDALPLEYKCHAFGGKVAAVQVIERSRALVGKHSLYTPGWEPIPGVVMAKHPPDDQVREAPPRLAEMVACAGTLGSALGTYMRIDFFGTTDGFVFNEFSSVPGGLDEVTPHFDEWFGRLWSELVPEAS